MLVWSIGLTVKALTTAQKEQACLLDIIILVCLLKFSVSNDLKFLFYSNTDWSVIARDKGSAVAQW